MCLCVCSRILPSPGQIPTGQLPPKNYRRKLPTGQLPPGQRIPRITFFYMIIKYILIIMLLFIDIP